MYAKKFELNPPELDDNGLLLYPELWDEAVADYIAVQNEVGPLTQAHWRLIRALREYYAKFGAPPAMSLLCRKQGIETDCIQRLFCTCMIAWRVAGLPDPGEEAKSYLGVK
jgi:tRNA 2-thiouridine synthesizing protein E